MIIVANTRKTAVRIAATAVFSEYFPLGEKMNEDTHVFDACVFENNGETRCFMAALPVDVAEGLAAEGAKLAGGVHRIKRLETAEHLLLRKFCPEYESALIFLPQDGGLRLLQIHDNLPAAAHYISNNADSRRDEFLLFYNSLENAPQLALVENENDFAWLGKFGLPVQRVQFSQEEFLWLK